MMGPALLPIYVAAALGAASDSTPSNSWIADLKANQAFVAGKALRLEGEVVDLRATSPMASRGLYRLIDASDAAGVLIRTDRLPVDGGTFRIRARVASSVSPDSLPRLDEIERERLGASPLLPVALAAGCGLALVVLAILFAQAAARERRNRVSAPLWLLPNLGPYGRAATAMETPPPSLQYEPDLEDADRLQREGLRRRKRRLLQALVLAGAATASSAAWAIETRHPSGPVPAFIFVDSDERPVAQPAPPVLADQPPAVVIDSAAKPAPVPASSLFATRPAEPSAPTLPARGRDSVAQRGGPAQEARRVDSARRVDTPAIVTPKVTPQVVAPPPAPAPPPSPPPATEPRSEAPDPVVDRARAADGLTVLAGNLVAAITARSIGEVARLMPMEVAADAGKQERFLNFVRDFGPRVVLGTVEDVTLAGDRAEARFTVAFSWRGDFGVERRKPGHFVGLLRRESGEWRPVGVRFVDGVP